MEEIGALYADLQRRLPGLTVQRGTGTIGKLGLATGVSSAHPQTEMGASIAAGPHCAEPGFAGLCLNSVPRDQTSTILAHLLRRRFRPYVLPKEPRLSFRPRSQAEACLACLPVHLGLNPKVHSHPAFRGPSWVGSFAPPASRRMPRFASGSPTLPAPLTDWSGLPPPSSPKGSIWVSGNPSPVGGDRVSVSVPRRGRALRPDHDLNMQVIPLPGNGDSGPFACG